MSIADKLTTITENQQRVYDAGQKSEYDHFWNVFQQNGNRTDYYYVFSGYGWTREIFRPKYDIKGTRFQGAFAFLTQINASLIDIFNECGITLDTSSATNISGIFQYSSSITEIPHIDMSSVTTSASNIFYYCSKLVRIEKITYTEHTSCYHNTAFGYCAALTDVEFDGIIAGDMNFEWSPLLSKTTLQSLISHLKDLTGLTAKTLKVHADVYDRFTDEQKAIISAKNWNLAK